MRRPVIFRFKGEAGDLKSEMRSVQREVVATDQALDSIDGRNIDIDFDYVDSLKALRGNLERDLAGLQEKIKLDPEIDTGRALKELRAYQRSIDNISADIDRRTKVQVDVDQDSATQTMSALSRLGSGISEMFTDMSGNIGKALGSLVRTPQGLAALGIAIVGVSGGLLSLAAAAGGVVAVGLSAWFAAVQNPASKAGKFVTEFTGALREIKEVAVAGFGDISGQLLASLNLDFSGLGGGLKAWIDENKEGIYEFMRASVEAGAAIVKWGAGATSVLLQVGGVLVAVTEGLATMGKAIYGFTLRPIVQAIAGVAEVASSLPGVGDQFGGIAEKARGLDDSIRGGLDSLDASADAYQAFAPVAISALDGVARGADRVQQAAAGAKGGADNLKLSYSGLAGVTADVTEAQSQALDEWRKSLVTSQALAQQAEKLSAVYASFTAPAIAYEQSLIGIADARKAAAEATDRQAGLAWSEREALVGLASAYQSRVDAMVQMGATQEQLSREMGRGRDAIVEQARELGLSRQAARDYATDLGYLSAKEWKIKLGLKFPTKADATTGFMKNFGGTTRGKPAVEVPVGVGLDGKSKAAVEQQLSQVSEDKRARVLPVLDGGAAAALRAQMQVLTLPRQVRVVPVIDGEARARFVEQMAVLTQPRVQRVVVTTATPSGSTGGGDAGGGVERAASSPVVIQMQDGRLVDFIGAEVGGQRAVIQRTYNRRIGVVG